MAWCSVGCNKTCGGIGGAAAGAGVGGSGCLCIFDGGRGDIVMVLLVVAVCCEKSGYDERSNIDSDRLECLFEKFYIGHFPVSPVLVKCLNFF